MNKKRVYVDKRMREKETSDMIGWKGEYFYKTVISNAFANAIYDHKKECHKKGVTIFGRKLR